MAGTIKLSNQDIADLYAAIHAVLEPKSARSIGVFQRDRLRDLKERLLKIEVNQQ